MINTTQKKCETGKDRGTRETQRGCGYPPAAFFSSPRGMLSYAIIISTTGSCHILLILWYVCSLHQQHTLGKKNPSVRIRAHSSLTVVLLQFVSKLGFSSSISQPHAETCVSEIILRAAGAGSFFLKAVICHWSSLMGLLVMCCRGSSWAPLTDVCNSILNKCSIHFVPSIHPLPWTSLL